MQKPREIHWTPPKRNAMRLILTYSILTAKQAHRRTLTSLQRDGLLQFVTSPQCGWVPTIRGWGQARWLFSASRPGRKPGDRMATLTKARHGALAYAEFVGPITVQEAPLDVLRALVDLGWLEGPDDLGQYTATVAGRAILDSAPPFECRAVETPGRREY
jgi:hypothetical protein